MTTVGWLHNCITSFKFLLTCSKQNSKLATMAAVLDLQAFVPPPHDTIVRTCNLLLTNNTAKGTGYLFLWDYATLDGKCEGILKL